MEQLLPHASRWGMGRHWRAHGMHAQVLHRKHASDCSLCPPAPLPPCPCCRSKGGNNNTYCHDSPLNYLDWHQALNDDDGLARFTKHMIGVRCVVLGCCSLPCWLAACHAGWLLAMLAGCLPR